MENYQSMGNQSYDTIGPELELHLEQDSRTRELRFVKVPDRELMYDSHLLQGPVIPSIDGYDFIDASDKSEISEILSDKLRMVILYKPFYLVTTKE